MKTINVEELPEPIARALESMVETPKASLRPLDDHGMRRRVVFQTRPGRALTSLRREDIYGDAL